MSRIGDNARGVRQARRSALMTQEHLAEAAGVSARTVARLERGEDASAETLRAVGAVLNLQLSGSSQDIPAISVSVTDPVSKETVEDASMQDMSYAWDDDGILGSCPTPRRQGFWSDLWRGGRASTARAMAASASASLDRDGTQPGPQTALVLTRTLQNFWEGNAPDGLKEHLTACNQDRVATWGCHDEGEVRLLAWLTRQTDTSAAQVRDVERHCLRFFRGDIRRDCHALHALGIWFAVFVLSTDVITWSAEYGILAVWSTIAALAWESYGYWKRRRALELTRLSAFLDLCTRLGMPASTLLRIAGDCCRVGHAGTTLKQLSDACAPTPYPSMRAGEMLLVDARGRLLRFLRGELADASRNGTDPRKAVRKAVRDFEWRMNYEKAERMSDIASVCQSIIHRMGGNSNTTQTRAQAEDKC